MRKPRVMSVIINGSDTPEWAVMYGDQAEWFITWRDAYDWAYSAARVRNVVSDVFESIAEDPWAVS